MGTAVSTTSLLAEGVIDAAALTCCDGKTDGFVDEVGRDDGALEGISEMVGL